MGIRMNTGQAPSFVLVPGMCATSYTWTPVGRELALRGHRALPVELPGHGFDTVFPPGYQGHYDEDTFVPVPAPATRPGRQGVLGVPRWRIRALLRPWWEPGVSPAGLLRAPSTSVWYR
jgi:hypothetical protein